MKVATLPLHEELDALARRHHHLQVALTLRGHRAFAGWRSG